MVFPLYDDDPTELPVAPLITWGLIALNVLIFLIEVFSGTTMFSMVASLGLTPASLIRNAHNPGEVPPALTLVTGMFLHNGWEHLIGNMICLWVFGDDIEEALGRVRFVVFYLLAGVFAALWYTVFNLHSTTPLIGASGAISGVLAAYLMLRPCAKVSVFILRAAVRVPACWVIGGWVALQLFLLGSRADDGVAYLAHVGGLIAGAGLFFVLRPAGIELFACVEQPDESEASA